MEYKKTIRILDPHGGWGDHDMGYYFYDKITHHTKYDTGLCNRIFHWEVLADLYLKSKDTDLQLLVQNKIWPELEILEVPYTHGVKYRETYGVWQSKYEYDELHMKTVFDIDNQNVKMATPISNKKLYSIYKNQKFDFNGSNHWYSNFGYETLTSIKNKINSSYKDNKSLFSLDDRPLRKIKIKHTLVKEHIEQKYQDCVGIHIRRGNGVLITEDDILSFPNHLRDEYRKFVKNNVKISDDSYKFYKDELYFKIIDKILEINPIQNIYISHDLPDRLMEHYYDRYPNSNIETKRDERYFYETYYANNNIDISHLINYGNVLDNVMDLMTLSHCNFIITSPHSSWSEFARLYKNTTWFNINDNFDKIVDEYKNLIIPNKKIL